MKRRKALGSVGLLAFLFLACGGSDSGSWGGVAEHHEGSPATHARGPNGGRLLSRGEFEIELGIFERGVPPEFRAWATQNGSPVSPAEVNLEVRLTRLGGRVEPIGFAPEEEFLRGTSTVYEPHSFEVSIAAVHDGENYAWSYESFEGRTKIDAAVAQSLGVGTEVAAPAVMRDTVNVYGRIRANPEHVREVRARFDGVVRGVHAQLGSTVQAGDKLLTVESDKSLNSYSILSPIGGVVTQRDANPGEQTRGRRLLTITDTSSVWADLSIFPSDRGRVRVGSAVSIASATGGAPVSGVVSTLEVLADENQSVAARVILENPDGQLVSGTFITAEVTAGEYTAPLAVKRSGLQTFRDFTVVYAQVGEEYEVRMLELGRTAGPYVEVLSGLEPGTRYVTENSYLIKADIEKAGASHDH